MSLLHCLLGETVLHRHPRMFSPKSLRKTQLFRMYPLKMHLLKMHPLKMHLLKMHLLKMHLHSHQSR